MATHTETASYSGRKFNISRKDGQQNKDGDPYFFEWIKEIPQVPLTSKRIFETRPKKEKTDYFELFQKIDGYFVGAGKREVNFGAESKVHLVVFMVDGEEDYTVDLGPFDGRYAMDFCKRLLDANFDPSKRISLQPYAIFDKTKNNGQGGWNIGISVYSGPNKMDASYKSAHLAGMPQPDEEKLRSGASNWYYDKVAEWLWAQLNTRVLEKLIGDPVSFKQPVNVPIPDPHTVFPPANGAPFPTEAPPVMEYETAGDDGDLPF